MTTMATEALRYHVYIVASNTQAPFALHARKRSGRGAPRSGHPEVAAVYAPTGPLAYDQTFLWGPAVVHRGAPPPLANLLRVNRKVPLTSFEQLLGFAAGPTSGPAAIRNLRPAASPEPALGWLCDEPAAFTYGPISHGHTCEDVADDLHAVPRPSRRERADPGRRERRRVDRRTTGTSSGSRCRGWGRRTAPSAIPTVHFTYAVNPFMVGNLVRHAVRRPDRDPSAAPASARGCHYVGNGAFVPGDDLATYRTYAGSKSRFWGSRRGWCRAAHALGCVRSAASWRLGAAATEYVQTAVIARSPFPADRRRPGCEVAGR